MNAGKTLFSQLMDCLPWSTFARIVDALSWRPLRANISVRRAVPGHGVRPTDLPGKPARH